MRVRRRLILIAALIAGCADNASPPNADRLTLEGRDHIYLGEVLDRAAFEARPALLEGQVLEIVPDQLIRWPLDDAGPGRLVDDMLSFACQPGGRLRSPVGWTLDARLVDELRLSIDTGHADSTYAQVKWRTKEGLSGHALLYDDRPGVRRFRVHLGQYQTWRGTITEISIGPRRAPTSAVRVGALRFGGQLEQLAARGAGWGEVLFDRLYRPSLFTTLPGSFRFPLIAPQDGSLHLDMGALGADPLVRFRVSVEHDGQVTTLLDETLSGADGWRVASISLDRFAGRAIDLLFETEAVSGSTPAIACWADPILRAGTAATRPPVFIYLVDTLRPDHTEPYNQDAVPTPNLNRLADSSIVFEQCVAQGSWTKSSLPSLMTSTWVSQHGVPHVRPRIPTVLPTLAETLRERGYRTASFITNRVAGHPTGLNRGFSVLFDAGNVNDGDADDARSLPEPLLPWLRAHQDEPLFVYVHTAEPHWPYTPPEASRVDHDYDGPVDGTNFMDIAQTDAERDFVISLYDGEVRVMDRALGEFLDALESMQLLARSIFVFTSDHGEAFQEHGAWGHGHSVHDVEVRVPLILHLPGDRLAGHRSARIARLLDVMTTVLPLLGFPVPPTAVGVNLIDDTRDPLPGFPVPGAVTENHRKGRNPRYQRAFIGQDWKVMLTSNADGKETVAVYELAPGGQERQPFTGKLPDLPRELLARLRAWSPPLVLGKIGNEQDPVIDTRDLEDLRALGYLGEGN